MKRYARSLVFAAVTLFSSEVLLAASETQKEAPKMTATATIAEQLMAAKGQRVVLFMRAGRDVEGTVGMLSKEVVEVKGLVGREFFDAVVRVDDVSAVVYRVRS